MVRVRAFKPCMRTGTRVLWKIRSFGKFHTCCKLGNPPTNHEGASLDLPDHPSLILAWWGGVGASANIFKAIFGTSMGHMLRGSKNGSVDVRGPSSHFFVEISRIHVEGVG